MLPSRRWAALIVLDREERPQRPRPPPRGGGGGGGAASASAAFAPVAPGRCKDDLKKLVEDARDAGARGAAMRASPYATVTRGS